MKYKHARPGANLLVWGLVVVAYAAAAATIIIETRAPGFRDLSRVGHMTIHAPALPARMMRPLTVRSAATLRRAAGVPRAPTRR